MPEKTTKIILGAIFGVIVLIVFGYFLITPFLRESKPIPSPSSPGTPSGPKEVLTIKSFEEAVQKLNTPQKLIDYLNQNFEITEKETETPLMPEEFFEKKKGTSYDYSVFTSYLLWKNNYESAIIRYKNQEGKTNAVVVFRDIDLPKTIIFTKQGISAYHHGWSFAEMFQKEEERLNTKITQYAVSYWTDKGELWPEEWQTRD